MDVVRFSVYTVSVQFYAGLSTCGQMTHFSVKISFLNFYRDFYGQYMFISFINMFISANMH